MKSRACEEKGRKDKGKKNSGLQFTEEMGRKKYIMIKGALKGAILRGEQGQGRLSPVYLRSGHKCWVVYSGLGLIY